MRQVSKRHAAVNAQREAQWGQRMQDRYARLAADKAAREALVADREAVLNHGDRDPLEVLRERRAARGLPVDRETLLWQLPMTMRKAIRGTRWTLRRGR